MQIVIEINDQVYYDIQYRFAKGMIDTCDNYILESAVNYGIVLPKGHGDLIDRYDAIKAIDDRHEYLMRDPIYRKKKGNQIDLIGIKQHIWDITPIVEKDREQK